MADNEINKISINSESKYLNVSFPNNSSGTDQGVVHKTVLGDAVQQSQDANDGETTFDFTGKNLNATALDSELTGNITYGASGKYSAVFGGKAAAQGKHSFACGTTTIARGAYSFASGDNSVALGADSHAEGSTTTAYGDRSHAEGYNTVSKNFNSHAEGDTTQALGQSSHAEGSTNIAEGEASHSEGVNTHAKGYASHAEGDTSKATADYAHSEGFYTNATALKAHAEGGETTASGECAHAEGSGTEATGSYSHSEGKNTKAQGEASHAEGCNTIALGEYSHAGGEGSTANGKRSFAHGNGCTVDVNALNGVAFGYNTSVVNTNEVAIGQFNSTYTNSTGGGVNPMLTVGIGTSSEDKKNAFEVLSNGCAVVQKKLTVGEDLSVTSGTLTTPNLTVSTTGGFLYSGIDSGTTNVARPVWFASADSSGTVTNGTPAVSKSLTYNPSTDTLTVANLSGNATSANKVAVSGGYNNKLYLLGVRNVSNAQECQVSGAYVYVEKGALTATSYNATSDSRLKENISDYRCDKSILDLPVKKFDFIDGPKNQIGCIAQDLQEICPEIVHENSDGYLSIQESKIVYLLLQEVKKLRAEVDELKGDK
jgi:hypothetical protein